MFQKLQIKNQIKLLLIGVCFLFMPILVQALGLGNARVLSKLNEPLNIELEILANNPKELQNILPNMANPEDFERAGIEKPDYLTTAQFKIETQTGKPIIRLTTIDAVKEPVVNLLIELAGSQGRVLKEYTVLLDPADFSKNDSLEVKLQPQSSIHLESNRALFDAFEEKMPLSSVANQSASSVQKAAAQSEENMGLQLRMSKVEAQLTELANQKKNLEQAKLLLNEENNNLHDLVELKQKEIEMLNRQPAPIQSQPKQASLSHFAKAQMIEPNEEEFSDASSSMFSPWLLLGLILIISSSAIFALREWFKRKEMDFPFSFSFPKFSFSHKSEAQEWQEDFPKNKPQNFQEIVSQFQNSEAEQEQKPIQKPVKIALPKQPTAEQVMLPLLEDADVYITFGKLKMAEEIILKILDHQPDNIQARLKLIDFFSSQGRSSEAEEHFRLLPSNFATDNPEQYAAYQKKFKPVQDTIAVEPSIQGDTTPSDSDIINNPILEPSAELIDSFSATPNTAAGDTVLETDPAKQDPSVFQTKLDFAKVYIDMQDIQSARDLLNEVIQSGPDNLKAEAQKILENL